MIMKVKNTVVCPLCKEVIDVPEGKTRSQALSKHLATDCSAQYRVLGR